MSKSSFITAPVETDQMPPRLPCVIGNDAAERFNFCAWLSIGCVRVFVFIAQKYQAKTYLQGDTPALEVQAEITAST